VLAYPSTGIIFINSSSSSADSLVIVKGRWNADQKTLTFGPPSVLSGVKPSVMMTGALVPTTQTKPVPKGVIVFINEHENNALTAVTVRKDPSTFTQPDKLAFGPTLKITDGLTDGSFQMNNGVVVPFVSANYIDETHLAISFSDLANLGRVATMVINLNPHTMELSVGSAKYVTSDPNPNFDTNFWWVVAQPLKFSTQVGYVLWQYLQTGNAETDVIKQSLVEVAPPPFGIVPDNVHPVNAGADAPVVISGVYKFVSGSAPFTGSVGRYWYTDTLGELHERNGTDASTGYVITDGVLLSLNSRIGVSISTTELLLVDEV